MTDEIQTPPPIQITDSTAKEQGGAGMRDFMLVVAALPALIAVFGKGDVIAAVNYIASAEFAPVLGVVAVAGVAIWRQFITRWSKQKLITTGEAAPNNVSQVIQK